MVLRNQHQITMEVLTELEKPNETPQDMSGVHREYDRVFFMVRPPGKVVLLTRGNPQKHVKL